MSFYRGLRRAGLSIDVVPPTAEGVADRKLILAPGLFAPRAEFIGALTKSGATLLIGPRSGSKTSDFQIPPDLPPGALRALVEVSVRRVESLRPGARIAVGDGAFERWREFLVLGEKASIELASTDGETALARCGGAFYLAGWPDEALLREVTRRLCSVAGVETLDLPEDIRVRDNGATRYFFNYGPEPKDISSLLGETPLLLGGRMLESCGVAAVRRKL